MLSWANFISILFWVAFFVFFLGANNFFQLLLVSEVLWVLLYVLAACLGVLVDDINLFSMTFFILGLAAVELSLGLLLLVFSKYLDLALNLGPEEAQPNPARPGPRQLFF
jgi:hypothetical protein